ncbi:MAG: SDR family oxidoreductase [Propionibacteriaceae bacterium]|jgi:3-oxoacyl-[acyl-carrier protein] reductase|nr:SDR family oxidoreductase [Propionibacteriaceae bacterium]
MEMGLTGQRALVTGSSKGIGKAIALGLAAEGVDVIVNGRHADEVEAVIAAIRQAAPATNPQAAVADLSRAEDREAVIAAHPDIDILVNNMGIFEPMSYWDITPAIWQKFFETNVLAGDALARAYLPGMLNRDQGRVIFIASEEAIMPSGEMAQYSMTKTMNLSLAKSLSKLTRGGQVTVNTVMPGSTLTEGVADMLQTMYADSGLPQSQWESDFMAHHRPLSQIQRLIRPEEIARLVVFVASPQAGAFSGAALRMDGGLVPTIF